MPARWRPRCRRFSRLWGARGSSGVLEWWSGGVVEWWSGGVVEWWSGGVVEWWGGGVVEWWGGGVVVCWSGGVLEVSVTPTPLIRISSAFCGLDHLSDTSQSEGGS